MNATLQNVLKLCYIGNMDKKAATAAIRTVNGEVLYVAAITRPNKEGDVTVKIVSIEVPTDDIIPVYKQNSIMVVPKKVLINL